MKFTLTTALLTFGPALIMASPTSHDADDVDQDALYTFRPNRDITKCIDVKGGKIVAGAAIDINECDGSKTQQWSNKDLRGFFLVDDDGERQCMDLPPTVDSQIMDGDKLLLAPCEHTGEDGNPTQIYTKPSAKNHYTMMLEMFFPIPGEGDHYSRKCIDLTNGSTEDGNVLQISGCSPDEEDPYWNQIWHARKVDPDIEFF